MSRSKKKQIKRVVKIVGTDQELVVSRVTAVNVDLKMIHFDQLADGTWRITYNERMIPDFTQVQAFEIVREE